MSDKLDLKRSYSTVYGDPHVKYEQDGKEYRPDGTLFVKGEPPPAPVVEEAKETEKQNRNRKRSEAMKAIWEKRKSGK